MFEVVVRRAGVAMAVWESLPMGSPARMVLVNDAFCELTGYGPTELLGSSPGVLVGYRDDQAMKERYRVALSAGQIHLAQ